MDITPIAKKVRFHINSGGKDCFSLKDLIDHFCLKDINNLIANGRLKEWLISLNDDTAKYIALKLTDNISDADMISLLFPKQSDDTDFTYLLKLEKASQDLFDTIFKQKYKYDKDIAIYGIKNNLIEIDLTASNDTPQKEGIYYLTKQDVKSLWNIENIENLSDYEIYLRIFPKKETETDLDYFLRFENNDKIFTTILLATYRNNIQIAEWGLKNNRIRISDSDKQNEEDGIFYLSEAEVNFLINSNPEKAELLKNYIDIYGNYKSNLTAIKAEVNKLLANPITEFYEIEKIQDKFGKWIINQRFYTENQKKYEQLVTFIENTFQMLYHYRRDKNDLGWSCHIGKYRQNNSPDYELCFLGLCDIFRSQRVSKDLLEESKDFPVSKFILDDWDNRKGGEITIYDVPFKLNGTTNEFKNFLKEYLNFTIDYLIKND